MNYFVKETSIVRKIWGKSDTILFIFAGASAEFALNKAVDWLYYTGKLPSDPLGRLFSTVEYARKIVFASEENALKAIDMMRQIHSAVEKSRGASIPDWAYRDVLFMLIHYSISAYEVLESKLSEEEKEEVYNVFYRVGIRMGLKELPSNYMDWLPVREQHLKENLQKSNFTEDLFKQYRKYLGLFRYRLLLEAQKLVVPSVVSRLLNFSGIKLLPPVLILYKICKKIKIDSFLKNLLLPKNYKKQIAELDIVH
ncbi:oxygenase MpaB family protein [Flavobacterium sp.]|uniref:oxygenase MpaB family protein n=1 Tax=Flavobacterium sp. TaxID=239 RepID=UPI0028BF2BC2|nr:oxygenase MpaB family protein [Flavobacterium sp.]